MPTSTATLTKTRTAQSPMSLKPTSSSKSTLATLRSLYPRAARAFLQRNFLLTHSLLLSAFSNLDPPRAAADALASHRRKWDLLRITLETTLYAAAPPAPGLPDALRALLVLAPPSLLATMHARSLTLFTPAHRGKPSAEFLPPQILVALTLAAIKLDCVQVGREMIEDWLARRAHEPAQDAAEGYEKVLEMYCLHVLPRLEDWDYARDFVRYEDELPADRKTYLVQSLQLLHAQHLDDRERQRHALLEPPSSSREPTPRPPAADRAPSPSPSATSASSTSTHTVMPHTARPHALPPSFTSLAPAPAPSPRPAAAAQRHSRAATPLPSPPAAPQMPAAAIPPPSLLALLRASLRPHLTTPNLTFLILMVLVPLVSFVVRLRRRRRLRIGGDVGWWRELRRAVADTVRMAGGGFV